MLTKSMARLEKDLWIQNPEFSQMGREVLAVWGKTSESVPTQPSRAREFKEPHGGSVGEF